MSSVADAAGDSKGVNMSCYGLGKGVLVFTCTTATWPRSTVYGAFHDDGVELHYRYYCRPDSVSKCVELLEN